VLNKLDPFDVEALERAVNDSATRVSTIWVSFLIFSLYLLIASTTVSQRQLLLADPLKLPVLNIDLPMWGFFFIAPILLVFFHIYVLLQVLLLGCTAAAYNTLLARAALTPEKDLFVRQRLANTLFAQIFAGSLREREGFVGLLLRVIVWITLAIAPILIVLGFLFNFLPYHSHLATWTHRILILIELGAFMIIWPLAFDGRNDFSWQLIKTDLRRSVIVAGKLFRPRQVRRREWMWLCRKVVPTTFACLLFIVVCLSLAAFPGEPHVNLLAGRPWSAVQCNGWFQETLELIKVGYNRFDLPDIDLDDSQKTHEFRGRDLNCGNFIRGKFRHFNFDHATMQGAIFALAQLQDASFEEAKLASANFQGADLREAKLGAAQLQGVFAVSAQFQGADLSSANLRGADLGEAAFQWARLRAGKLEGAYLHQAILQGADLSYAHLEGAFLLQARLQGADLEDGNLSGAFLRFAQMQGVVFPTSLSASESLDLARFSETNLWHSWEAFCYDAQATNSRFDNVVDEKFDLTGQRVGALEATPDGLEQFVANSVKNLPADDRDRKKAILTKRLSAKSDYDAEKRWRDCERFAKPKTEYQAKLFGFARRTALQSRR
jgi:uncharacterized protein YjbI with pentapeptide repeats